MLRHPDTGLPPSVRADRLAWWLRGALMLGGGMPLGMLLVAAWLTPNAAGLGTHHQLGFPPCSMRVYAGIRCPSCGMTTSWSHMVRGQVPQAMAANAGGALLAVAAALVGPWLVACGVVGRWIGGMPNEWAFAGVSVAILVVTLIDWSVRLFREYG